MALSVSSGPSKSPDELVETPWKKTSRHKATFDTHPKCTKICMKMMWYSIVIYIYMYIYNYVLYIHVTVEGWSQSNFLECGQTACGKVATTGSQQGHSNPSKHKGIAFIWRIQSTIITNTREPTPRTADYSSASTALIWEGVRLRERRKQWKEKKQQSVRKKRRR